MFVVREGVLRLKGGMSLCILLGLSKMESKFGALANLKGYRIGGSSSEQAHNGFEM